MDKKGEGLLIGIVAFFLIFASLPALGAMAGSALYEATSVLLAIAPKVAVVSGIGGADPAVHPVHPAPRTADARRRDPARDRRGGVLDRRRVARGAQRDFDGRRAGRWETSCSPTSESGACVRVGPGGGRPGRRRGAGHALRVGGP